MRWIYGLLLYKIYRRKRRLMIERIRNIIVWVVIIIAVAMLVSLTYLYSSKRLEYIKPYRYLELTYDPTSLKCSREIIRDDLNKIFDARFYTYKEKNLDDIPGRTNPFTRTVIMDDDISLYVYAFNLAHELVHLTHFTNSERYCNLIAFKTLYDTEKYKDVAIRYAIRDRDGYINKKYSCWEYIYDYLIERQDI